MLSPHRYHHHSTIVVLSSSFYHHRSLPSLTPTHTDHHSTITSLTPTHTDSSSPKLKAILPTAVQILVLLVLLSLVRVLDRVGLVHCHSHRLYHIRTFWLIVFCFSLIFFFAQMKMISSLSKKSKEISEDANFSRKCAWQIWYFWRYFWIIYS